MSFTGTRGDQAVRARAYDLAESGRFHSVRDVAQALIREGWSNAHAVLDSDYARKAIHERIAGAGAGAGTASGAAH